jgi:hypothetical protein
MSEPATGEPIADRPRMFGGHLEPTRLPWTWAERRLVEARNYWIATVRPDGGPHTRPVWGVWLDGAFWFSTGSLADTNLRHRADVTLHLESGSEVVILEAIAQQITDTHMVRPVVEAYNSKYAWDVDPDNPPGPFWRVAPVVAFGWLSDDSGFDRGAAFHGTATRWRFASG